MRSISPSGRRKPVGRAGSASEQPEMDAIVVSRLRRDRRVAGRLLGLIVEGLIGRVTGLLLEDRERGHTAPKVPAEEDAQGGYI
jgi:hypothetical protein